jgi:arginyl-tRNA synthetase
MKRWGILFCVIFIASIDISFPFPAFAAPKAGSKASSNSKSECEFTLAPISTNAPADPARLEAVSLLRGALRILSPATDDSGIAFETLLADTPNFSMGQIAFPAFQFSKVLKKNPKEIAPQLAEILNTASYSMLTKAEPAGGGYVNFHIAFKNYAERLLRELQEGRLFKANPPTEKEKISLEWSQPNTHKALHIGHMRNMFLGESVARLLEYFGHDVVRSTYPGDMGAHVAKALWYINTHKREEIPSSPSAEWLGKMYAEADAYVKANESDALIQPGISAMLKSIESCTGEDYEFYQRTREWSLDEMRRIYDWIGIHFDEWHFESECDVPSRQLVQEKYEAGVLEKDAGAIGLNLKSEGLDFVLMLKSDGTGNYLTKDLELLRRKFSDPDVTRSIVVVDERQRHHFRQVFRSAELLGFPEAKKSIHLPYETVMDGAGNAFSSRTLNGLGLSQIREAVENKIPAETADRLGRSRSQLAVDNLRYGFLKVAPANQIRFDLDQWLQNDNDSAIGLIAQIRRLESMHGGSANGDLSDLEKQIVFHVGRFNRSATKAAQTFDPSEITKYLGELNSLLNKWPSADSPNQDLVARLSAGALREGLRLLGISDI